MRLNPLAGDADLIAMGTRWYPLIRIDGFRKIANRTGLYLGQTPQEWCGEDGAWKDVWLGPGNPLAARCGVYRKGNEKPIYGVASWNDFGKGKGQNWPKMPAHMLSKVAESLSIRKAFPEQFAGSYTEYEDVGTVTEEDTSSLSSINDEFGGTPNEQKADTNRQTVKKDEPLTVAVDDRLPETDNDSHDGEYVIEHGRFAGQTFKEISPDLAREYMQVLTNSKAEKSVALLKKMTAFYG